MPDSQTPQQDTSPEPFTIAIEKLVYGGDALGRRDGKVVLSPFLLPGETARVEPAKELAGLTRARPLEVIEPSPDRVEALCPYFTRCGGCHYQHAGYPAQLEQKVHVLRDTFSRIGKIQAPEQIDVIAAHPWQYRNRTQFHIDSGRIGYRRMGSHELCAVEVCPISSPKLNEVLKTLTEMVREPRFPSTISSIEIFTNEQDVQLSVREARRPEWRPSRDFLNWCAERIPGATPDPIRYEAAGFSFTVGPRSFFQVNRLLVDQMVERVVEGVEAETALELYAGVGLFSLPLASKARVLTAVESAGSAVRDLQRNAADAGRSIAVIRSAADVYLSETSRAPDFVLADPPRSGLGKYTVRHLIRLKPRRLTVIGCDPATLARDAAALLQAGYRWRRVTLVDLFPQTFHMETVADLELTT